MSSSKRTLLVQSSNFPVEVLYLRDDDIPQSVAGGVADLVSWVKMNLWKERRMRGGTPSGLQQVPPFVGHTQGCGLFRPFLVRRQEDSHFLSQYPEKIHEGKRVEADIHVITGSVEIAPGIGLADGIFDIVSSGSTLVSNNLQEVAVVMKSEALLIANRNMDDAKKAILDELLFRIEAVKSAEDKKYVLMNVPSDKVKRCRVRIARSQKPTVMPLAQEGWSSVHTVIDESRFGRLSPN